MEFGQAAFLIVALLLMAFTLGAVVAWRLEGRRPLAQPFWLMVTRNVSAIVFGVFLVTNLERPTGNVIAIDLLWWNLMTAVILIGPLVVAALELRRSLRDRRSP